MTKLKKLELVWIIQKEAHEDWIKEWMDLILAPTSALKYKLHISLFILGGYKNPATVSGTQKLLGEHRRILKHYNEPDLNEIIEHQVEHRKGQTLILACLASPWRDPVRLAATSKLQLDIDFQELYFEPV
ncbi:hypothetical protein TWF281_002141 [Arthrobotrys megalospora]